ncbi:MAG: hypothetical protein HUJ92_02955 [Bacteroidales bacterium]|nr:hypothetical protein [Bacteroidales bacterium]
MFSERGRHSEAKPKNLIEKSCFAGGNFTTKNKIIPASRNISLRQSFSGKGSGGLYSWGFFASLRITSH